MSLAPQEPTSSLLRSGANNGKKELQEEEEEDDEVQGGQEGRRSQEAKPRRLIGKQGVANNREIKMDVGSLIAGIRSTSASNDPLNLRSGSGIRSDDPLNPMISSTHPPTIRST